MIMEKKKLFRFLRIGIRWFAMILASILMMSGFVRFVELNTECDGFSYYQFLDVYCETSGFFNYKVRCDIPLGNELYCYNDMLGFRFDVVRTSNYIGFVDYNVDDVVIDFDLLDLNFSLENI